MTTAGLTALCVARGLVAGLVVLTGVGAPTGCAIGGADVSPASQLRPAVSLQVSDFLMRELVVVTRRRYSLTAATELFERMRPPGDAFCTMFFRRKPVERKIAGLHIVPEHLGPYLRARPGRDLLRMGPVAGCWNFFGMNDRRPDAALRAARTQLGAPAGHCFSVGFMQPYLMSVHLGCRLLTFIDFDWRIIDAHLQMIRMFRAGGFASREAARRSLASLRLAWAVRDGKLLSKMEATPENLCPSGRAELCLDALVRFQREFTGLQEIRLQLASLHEADFGDGAARVGNAVSAQASSVGYLSNAASPDYMSEREFEAFLEAVAAALPGARPLLLIRHAAGGDEFQVFKLVRVGRSFAVRLLCSAGRAPGEKARVTHFTRFMPRNRLSPEPSACVAAAQ